jgi:hypothetical protein
MKREANYHEFNELPAGWTVAQWGDRDEYGDGRVVNEADDYKWSGENAPPAIGAVVKIYMNDFKGGTVVGYFAEYGWLGVLIRPTKPPAWWVRQNKERAKETGKPIATCGHFFGIDLEPRKALAPS